MRNPTRRSRNIGTKKQGHGADNRMVVPSCGTASRTWFESVRKTSSVVHLIHGRKTTFITEELSPGFFHACSPELIQNILQLITAQDLEGMEAILFRQPTRKQVALKPTWGRLTYFAEVGRGNEQPLYEGPLVTLEAQTVAKPMRWSKSLDAEDQRELARLKQDGHTVEDLGRHFLITATPNSIRRTQLLRTLPHEIGHWVDYLEKVERPSTANGSDFSRLHDEYFGRPSSERERFAHRYAEDFLKRNESAIDLILTKDESQSFQV